jgi:DNA-binding transcriptional MerR regulator
MAIIRAGMATPFEGGELVRRCVAPTEEQDALWLRRVRHWANLGILPSTQRGAGKHRFFRENTAFLASVLLRFSDLGATTEILRELSMSLQRADRGRSAFARLWRQTKEGDVAAPIHLWVFQPVERHPEIDVRLSEGLLLNPALLEAQPAIILNLSKVFAEVRAAAEENDE